MSPAPLFPAETGAAVARHEGLTVFVRGLTLQAGIGVYDHEHGRLQTLVIDVELTLAPGPVERLADTVNYETVATAAQAIANESHVALVETFAQRLALACIDDPLVRRCAVRIEKPGALQNAAAPGCEVILSR